MPLVNFTKTELQYIEVALYMLSKEKEGEVLHSEESIKNIETILEKVGQLKEVCECGGQTNWYIIHHNEVVTMSDEEIKTFITTFKSFMQHADVEEMNYLRRESTRKYKQLYYQSQAKKHNVSYDYYLSEFT